MPHLNLQVRCSSKEPWSTLNTEDHTGEELSYINAYAKLLKIKDDWHGSYPMFVSAMFRIISDKRLAMEQEREAYADQTPGDT